jgi:hypothetical protein
MAKYYWTGAVSSNVNNLNNWTLWGPNSGVTLPAAAPARPTDGDDILFVRFSGTGTGAYPLNAPTGFLTGISGGNTAAQIGLMQVQENFPRNLGSTASYLKFYARDIDLTRGSTSGFTYAYLELVQDPTGVCGPDKNPHVQIKCKTSGPELYIKGNAWEVKVPQVSYPTYAKIYTENLRSLFACENVNSRDQFYFYETTTEPNVYKATEIINSDYEEKFLGYCSINVGAGFDRETIFSLQGNGITMTFTQVGVSGSTPAGYTATTFTKLNVGTIVGSVQTSSANIVNVNHQSVFDNLNINYGTVNFNDANSVSIVADGEFFSDKAVLKTTQVNNLEVANMTIKNLNGSSSTNITLSGNYDITLYPEDPLA